MSTGGRRRAVSAPDAEPFRPELLNSLNAASPLRRTPLRCNTNAEGVRQFQPRVASTLGKESTMNATLKALAKAARRFANAYGVDCAACLSPRVVSTLGKGPQK